jgi:hypothetical protein
MESQKATHEPTTQIIHSIEELRNERIAKLLRGDDLNAFIGQYYEVAALSKIKLEFLRRDLMELLHAPLDLVHYSSLIREVKDKGINPEDSPLFLNELDLIFQKYIVK